MRGRERRLLGDYIGGDAGCLGEGFGSYNK